MSAFLRRLVWLWSIGWLGYCVTTLGEGAAGKFVISLLCLVAGIAADSWLARTPRENAHRCDADTLYSMTPSQVAAEMWEAPFCASDFRERATVDHVTVSRSGDDVRRFCGPAVEPGSIQRMRHSYEGFCS